MAFLQLTIEGISIGCIYALIALGFVLIYKATEVVNFAQGGIMMLGVFVAFTFASLWGLSFWLTIALTIAVLVLVLVLFGAGFGASGQDVQFRVLPVGEWERVCPIDPVVNGLLAHRVAFRSSRPCATPSRRSIFCSVLCALHYSIELLCQPR